MSISCLKYTISRKNKPFFRDVFSYADLFSVEFLNALHDILKFGVYIIIITSLVWKQALGAILYAVLGIFAVAAALFAQRKQRAIAEQAVKILRMFGGMAGKIFTFGILKKSVIAVFRHSTILRMRVCM